MVIGARVGDAMGAPLEGLDRDEIRTRFGWVEAFSGDGTDDSLMASLLADALIAGNGYAGADEWAAQWIEQQARIWSKRDRFFPSVLHSVEKLRYGLAPRQVATGNMPSSSSAMSIWPVGLVNAGDPVGAAVQAYALAALIHVGEVDFCQDGAAAVAAAVAAGLRPGTTASEACHEALEALHPISGTVMRRLISDSMSLAEEASGYEEFCARYRARFDRPIACDSRETVPAVFALVQLADGDLRRGVELAANFGRDTDTIATMTGAICGAISGPDAIPELWIESLGSSALADARDLARDLSEAARAKVEERARLAGTVPGLLDRVPERGSQPADVQR